MGNNTHNYVTIFTCRKQEAQLQQRDRATRFVSKFVLCFTKYGS